MLYVNCQNWADRRSSTNLHIWDPNVFQMALSYPVCINLKHSTQKRRPQHGTAGQPLWCANMQLPDPSWLRVLCQQPTKEIGSMLPQWWHCQWLQSQQLKSASAATTEKLCYNLLSCKMVQPRNASRMQTCYSVHDLVVAQHGWHCQQDVDRIINAIQVVCWLHCTSEPVPAWAM